MVAEHIDPLLINDSILKTITELKEFESLLQNFNYLIVYIYSPWSGISEMGLTKIKAQITEINSAKFYVIDNSEGNSFINLWLSNQEINDSKASKEVRRARIHGNGELICIRKAKVHWFGKCVMDIAPDQLNSLFRID